MDDLAVWLVEAFPGTLSVWLADCLLCSRVLLLACVASLLVVWWATRRKESYNVPPGSMGLPVVGETAAFLRNGHVFFDSRLTRHGPIFKTSLLGSPTVVVCGPSNIGKILLAEGKSVIIQLQPSTTVLLGDQTVSTSTGARHRELHKTFGRTMQRSTLAQVTPHIHATVREFVGRWRRARRVASGVDELKALALTTATRTLLPLGLDKGESQRVIDLFNVFNDAFFSFPINLPGFAFRKGLWARDELKKIIVRRLKELVHEHKPDSSGKLCILLRLITCYREMQTESQGTARRAADSPDSDDNLEDFHNVALEMVFASFETTASAMCAICICLAEHPEVMDKIREEMTRLGLMTEDILTYSDVTSATYVSDVRDEVLRMMPPIAGAFRRALEPIDIMGYTIPPGWIILYTIPPTHHLSKRFAGDHGDFNPDRWSTHRKQNKDGHVQSGTPDDETPSAGSSANVPPPTVREAFDFVPFGGGPRICVGREYAKLVLNIFIMELVRTGSWSLPNGRPAIKTAPIPFPIDNLPMDFHT